MSGHRDNLRYSEIAHHLARALEDLVAMVEKHPLPAAVSRTEEMTEIVREIAETRRAMNALTERLTHIDQLIAEIVRLQAMLDSEARQNGAK